jgi:hypothetical protein
MLLHSSDVTCAMQLCTGVVVVSSSHFRSLGAKMSDSVRFDVCVCFLSSISR